MHSSRSDVQPGCVLPSREGTLAPPTTRLTPHGAPMATTTLTEADRRQIAAEVTETADFLLEQLDKAGARPYTQLMALLAAARVRHAELKKFVPSLPEAEQILKDIAASAS